MTVYGGVEGGGTKVVAAVGSGPDDLRAETVLATMSPAETLAAVVAFFAEAARSGLRPSAVGLAWFGPLVLDEASPAYGHMGATPKPGWTGADVAGRVAAGLGVPVGFDTDVNGAALGEWRWGAAQGLDDFIYLTVGTGIGGAALTGGRLVHGSTHPEMGHMLVPRASDDPFPGICPFHGDCLEGLAAGPAIEARWGRPAHQLGPHAAEAVELEARYLAAAVANLVLTLAPQRVVLGGGVAKLPGLIEATRTEVAAALAGYALPPALAHRPDRFLVRPALGDRAGVLGALVLAEQAAGRAGGPARWGAD